VKHAVLVCATDLDTVLERSSPPCRIEAARTWTVPLNVGIVGIIL
jgi:hypothetical protein